MLNICSATSNFLFLPGFFCVFFLFCFTHAYFACSAYVLVVWLCGLFVLSAVVYRNLCGEWAWNYAYYALDLHRLPRAQFGMCDRRVPHDHLAVIGSDPTIHVTIGEWCSKGSTIHNAIVSSVSLLHLVERCACISRSFCGPFSAARSLRRLLFILLINFYFYTFRALPNRTFNAFVWSNRSTRKNVRSELWRSRVCNLFPISSIGFEHILNIYIL